MPNNLSRLLAAIAASLLAIATPLLAHAADKPFAPLAGARSRVIFVNDLSGDIDGLYAGPT